MINGLVSVIEEIRFWSPNGFCWFGTVFFDVQAVQVRFAASLFVVCGLRLGVCFVLMRPHSASMGFLCCTLVCVDSVPFFCCCFILKGTRFCD